MPCDPARDGERIRSLTRENFYAAMQAEWNEARHQQEPLHPERYQMVRRAGETIGFFAIRFADDHLYVQTIQLVAGARGAGIGTYLMNHIRQLAVARGLPAIRLRVLRANPRARQLYERLGYAVVEDHPTSVVMQLTL